MRPGPSSGGWSCATPHRSDRHGRRVPGLEPHPLRPRHTVEGCWMVGQEVGFPVGLPICSSVDSGCTWSAGGAVTVTEAPKSLKSMTLR